MPSKPKWNHLKHQPVFKISNFDRRNTGSELQVFAEVGDDVEHALSGLMRAGLIDQTISKGVALEMTCKAAELAFWSALAKMRDDDMGRFSRSFYLSNTMMPPEGGADYDLSQLPLYPEASSDVLTGNELKDVPLERPLGVDDTLSAQAVTLEKMLPELRKLQATLRYLTKRGRIDAYIKNSKLNEKDQKTARSAFDYYSRKIDVAVFEEIGKLFSVVKPRNRKYGEGRPKRIFERYYLYCLFPLWSDLTGGRPTDGNQNFIDLVAPTYRHFAYDPPEVAADRVLFKRLCKKGLYPQEWDWNAQLTWAVQEYLKTPLEIGTSSLGTNKRF